MKQHRHKVRDPWIKPVKEFPKQNRINCYTKYGTTNSHGRELFNHMQIRLGPIIDELCDKYKPHEVAAIANAVIGILTSSYAATYFHLCENTTRIVEKNSGLEGTIYSKVKEPEVRG